MAWAADDPPHQGPAGRLPAQDLLAAQAHRQVAEEGGQDHAEHGADEGGLEGTAAHEGQLDAGHVGELQARQGEQRDDQDHA